VSTLILRSLKRKNPHSKNHKAKDGKKNKKYKGKKENLNNQILSYLNPGFTCKLP
jgi:hypothetical protein